MKKLLIASMISAGALVIIFGVYFVVRGRLPDDLNSQRTKLQSDLAAAQVRLNAQKQKLSFMISGLKDSFSLEVTMQDEMKKATDLVNRTNFMFTDATGTNPQLIVNNPLAGVSINDQRKDINLVLAEWEKKSDIGYIKKINLTESEKIKQQAEAIQEYIYNLTQIVGSLTTENSSLSQFQIDTYLSRLPSADNIEEVVATITAAIQNASNPNSSTVASGSQNSTTAGNTQTGTTSSGQTQTQNNSGTTIVTPDDIIAQQNEVEETENEVAVIENQLQQVEEQIQPPPPTPPTPAPETPAPVVENNNQNNNQNSGSVNSRYTGPPIVIQPGPPRLIQGTDPF